MSSKHIIKYTLLLLSIIGYLLINPQPIPQPDFEKKEVAEVAPADTAPRLIPEGFFLVTKVVDGDTIKVNYNGTVETIRLIGINTPETVDPRREVECFGKEASAYLKKLLENNVVRIENDESQGKRDRYDRMLAYIYLEDGTLVNQRLIEEGFAFEYTYDVPYMYQSEFKKAEMDARSSGKGLWAKDTCNHAEVL